MADHIHSHPDWAANSNNGKANHQGGVVVLVNFADYQPPGITARRVFRLTNAKSTLQILRMQPRPIFIEIDGNDRNGIGGLVVVLDFDRIILGQNN